MFFSVAEMARYCMAKCFCFTMVSHDAVSIIEATARVTHCIQIALCEGG